MNRKLSVLLLAQACALLIPACSQLQQQQETTEKRQQAEPEMPAPLYLGSVHQVFPTDQFALLRIIGPIPKEGTVLISHPADGTASRVSNLVVSTTPQGRNGIIAADIRAGLVLKGDLVFQYRDISAAAGEEEEDEEAPQPFTLTGVDLDTSPTPPNCSAQLLEERITPEPEDEPVDNEPATTPEPENEPTLPDVPDSPGGGKFDDIPDTIGGWDSF